MMGYSSAILIRAGYIQLVPQLKLESLARRQFQTRVLIRPKRGLIFDRNGEPLAINSETSSLAANPIKIKKKKLLAHLLGQWIHLSEQKIYEKLSENREFVWIKRHLSQIELKQFRKWKIMNSEGELADGLWLIKENERVYPHQQLASHIIGTVNIDTEGIEGTELWMNEKLSGKVASVSSVRDALGRPIFIDSVAAQELQDGESIFLTIDASLQFEVEQKLQEAVIRTKSQAGIVIVMNALDGEILSFANWPTFDPQLKNIPSSHRRNRGLTDGYEPGSTLKTLLTVSALLNNWSLKDRIWAEKGSFFVQGHPISEAMSHEKFEWLNLKEMLQVSSNIAAAKVALKLGADRYLKTLQMFQMGMKTGSGFPGEFSGKIPPRRDWVPLVLANIGFGQGILVTPLQMTRAYAALLNGGWLLKPKFILNQNEKLSEDSKIKIFPEKISHDVVTALEAVVSEGGTGMRASLPGFRIAGKTGTSQMVDSHTGKYSKKRHIGSFIGFALNVNPKIVIFTSLVEPQGSYYAAQTAVPFFNEVMRSVISRYGLSGRKSSGALFQSNPSSINHIEKSFQKLAVYQVGVGKWKMPSLLGLTPREVVRAFSSLPLKLEIVGSGFVLSHVPAENEIIQENETILIQLGVK